MTFLKLSLATDNTNTIRTINQQVYPTVIIMIAAHIMQ